MAQDGQDVVWDMLGSHATCMLVTRSGTELRARPMSALPDRCESALWFITGTAGEKDDEILANPSVCVTVSRPSENDFLSLTGEANIAEDREKLRQLWNDAAQAFFPGGPDSPDVRLIRVDLVHGEYWDAPGNKIIVGLEMIQARVSGERPDFGENEKVRF